MPRQIHQEAKLPIFDFIAHRSIFTALSSSGMSTVRSGNHYRSDPVQVQCSSFVLDATSTGASHDGFATAANCSHRHCPQPRACTCVANLVTHLCHMRANERIETHMNCDSLHMCARTSAICANLLGSSPRSHPRCNSVIHQCCSLGRYKDTFCHVVF